MDGLDICQLDAYFDRSMDEACDDVSPDMGGIGSTGTARTDETHDHDHACA